MASDERISAAMRSRGIEYLMHFTPAQNLSSIIEHGLRPRSELERDGIPHSLADPWRHDGDRTAVAFSISTYDWHMLSSARRRAPDTDWVMLGINPAALAGARCRFRVRGATPYGSMFRWPRTRALADFVGLFEDRCPSADYRGTTYRGEFSIPDYLPTDPGAEVLRFGPVPPRHVLFAMADGRDLGVRVERELARLPGRVRPVYVGAYEPRFATPYGAWG